MSIAKTLGQIKEERISVEITGLLPAVPRRAPCLGKPLVLVSLRQQPTSPATGVEGTGTSGGEKGSLVPGEQEAF